MARRISKDKFRIQVISNKNRKEISLLQKKFNELLKETSFKYFPNNNIENLVFKDRNNKEEIRNEIEEAEEIIQKITNKTVFSDTKLTFLPQKNENFENGIKRLRSSYEERTETLEKNMDDYKNILENYYRRKIQNAKNFQLNSMDYPNSNLSIMNITTEHNEKLKQLRELYQEKLKSFEQVYHYINIDIFRYSQIIHHKFRKECLNLFYFCLN